MPHYRPWNALLHQLHGRFLYGCFLHGTVRFVKGTVQFLNGTVRFALIWTVRFVFCPVQLTKKGCTLFERYVRLTSFLASAEWLEHFGFSRHIILNFNRIEFSKLIILTMPFFPLFVSLIFKNNFDILLQVNVHKL